MDKAICVYCSSANNVAPQFFDFARQLGAEMARQGYALVYGGTDVGLMGALARSIHEHGGKVIGVIPVALHERGIAYELADELIITRDMRERKATMEARATAFAALPGGFGTLEELFEILTLKQLQYHGKPIVVLNTHGFYDPLLSLFEHIYEQKFARPDYRELYHVTADLPDLFAYLAQYQPPQLKSKWA
ncbi:MAG: TIGR00730 family Rossman fold protein [Mycobacterium leprae]